MTSGTIEASLGYAALAVRLYSEIVRRCAMTEVSPGDAALAPHSLFAANDEVFLASNSLFRWFRLR